MARVLPRSGAPPSANAVLSFGFHGLTSLVFLLPLWPLPFHLRSFSSSELGPEPVPKATWLVPRPSPPIQALAASNQYLPCTPLSTPRPHLTQPPHSLKLPFPLFSLSQIMALNAN